MEMNNGCICCTGKGSTSLLLCLCLLHLGRIAGHANIEDFRARRPFLPLMQCEVTLYASSPSFSRRRSVDMTASSLKRLGWQTQPQSLKRSLSTCAVCLCTPAP